MNFAKTYTLESTAYPGVVVTLTRMGPKRRAEVELSVAGARSKQREISTRYVSATKKVEAGLAACPKDSEGRPIEAEMTPETIAHALARQAAEAEYDALVKTEIDPVFVKAALKSFGGSEPLTYEGAAATVDLLLEYGPDDLLAEVVAAINGNGYISAESARNLSLPSTSGAAEAGEATSSTVLAASPDASTLSATAAPDIPTT